MHTEVALAIKMPVREDSGLRPPMECLPLFVVEEGDDAFLVVNVSFLADKWVLHLVDGLLEELFVFADQ